MKKWAIGFTVVLLIAFFICIGGAFALHEYLCDEVALPEIRSPDGQYVLEVIESRCGIPPDFRTDIMLTYTGSWFPRWTPAVFGTKKAVLAYSGGARQVTANWLDAHTLSLAYWGECSDRWLKRTEWRDVQIVYDRGFCEE